VKQVSEISLAELKKMAETMYGDLVKADVDVAKKIVWVDGELHADMEAAMLAAGSHQNDLWGINLYPEKFGSDDFIEFDSMINIRPRQKNFSRDVEDPKIREQIKQSIAEVIYE
jgi:hypothetical protein